MSAQDSLSAPITAETRTRRRFRPVYLLFFVLAVVVYALPLLLFVREARDVTTHVDPGPQAVSVGLQIGVADFAKESVTFHILPNAGAILDANGRLKHDLTLEVDPGTGPLTHTFRANTQLAPWSVKATVDAGDILDYPFDRYEIELAIDAKSEGQTLKVVTSLDHVPHGLTATQVEHPDANGDDTVVVTLRRAGTIIFVVFLSTLSLLLVSIAACSVAWQVAYRGRKIEFSMMVWVAALLFVIPTVRNALPGAVPPGALIDFLIFFWLQIATVIAMSSLVVTWIRRAGT
jgi:hypothetical protein